MPPALPPVVAFAAQALGSFVLSQAITMATKPKKALPNPQRNRMLTSQNPQEPWRLIYGRVRCGGSIVFSALTGGDREFLHLVVVVAAHQVEAIDKIFFDEKELAFDGSGFALTPSAYFNRVYREVKLGSPSQTAVTMFGEVPEWTSNHRLRGRAYVYFRILLSSTSAFPGGQLPNITFEIRGNNQVWDPRTDTFVYTTNAALCQADYLSKDYGVGTTIGKVSEDQLIAAANISDEAVPLAGGGTEPRYTCNGVFYADQTPEEILGSLSSAMGVDAPIFIAGEWYIYPAAYISPTLDLNEDDARGPVRVTTRLSRRDLENRVHGLYVGPKTNFQASSYPPVVNATYLSQDGGEELWGERDYLFTETPSACQRLAKIDLEENRQQIQVEFPASFAAYRTRPPKTVRLSLSRFGWTLKPFRVKDMKLEIAEGLDGSPQLQIRLFLRETAAGAYDWNSGEETTVDLAPDTDLPDPLRMDPPTLLTLDADSSTAQEIQDGIYQPRIRVGWVPPADIQLRGYLLQFKLSSASEWQTAEPPAMEDSVAFITGVRNLQSYDVRLRAYNLYGVNSTFATDTITVNTRNSAYGGAFDPNVGSSLRHQGNLFSNGDMRDAEEWETVTSATTNVIPADVNHGIPAGADNAFSNPTNAHDADADTYADGAYSKAGATILTCGYAWGWSSTAARRGSVRVKAKCAQVGKWTGNGRLLFSPDAGVTETAFAYLRAGSLSIDPGEFFSPDLGLVPNLSQLRILGRGFPSNQANNNGTIRVHEIDFLEVAAPYSSVGSSIGSLISDGITAPYIRRSIGRDGYGLVRSGAESVAVIAARRVGGAATAPLKMFILDAITGTRWSLLEIQTADLTADWRYFAVLFTPTSDVFGQLLGGVDTLSTALVQVDRLSLTHGPNISPFLTSVEEQLVGYFGDLSAPEPLGFPAGAWTTGTDPTAYKISEAA